MSGLNPFASRLRRRLRRGREDALRTSGWYDISVRSELDTVFIGGCGRSGTTLFKELLNRHSRCACGPETSLYGLAFDLENISVPWKLDQAELESMRDRSRNLIEFADEFAGRFLSSEGKARWVEKTPNNVRAIDRLLTWYPNGRFIHVVRDGRDVVCSLRHHPKERVRAGRIEPVRVTNPIEKTAQRWLRDTSRGLSYKEHPRCLEVRYETFVRDPEHELRRVCSFIGERYEPGMLDPAASSSSRPGQFMNNERASEPISDRSIGRWEWDLPIDERKRFVDIAGELLIALGYASDHSWASLPPEERPDHG